MGGEIASLAQFGFAAVAAAAMWTFVKNLIPKLIDVNTQLIAIVEQNSRALTETAAALREVVAGQRDQATRLGRMDDRLLVLEEQHKRIAECPFGATGPRTPGEIAKEALGARGGNP